MKKMWIFIGLSFILFAFFFLSSAPVYADGGAPNLAYISGTTPGISVIDIAQQKVIDTLNVPGNPGMIFLSIDGRLLYVTQPELHRISVIITKTKQILCTVPVPERPTLLALDPGANILYSTGPQSHQVQTIDPLTCVIKHTTQIAAPISGLAIALMGNSEHQVWITDNTGLLHIFSEDGRQIATLPLHTQAQYICIPPGRTAYITTLEGEVRAIDLQTHQISSPLLTNGVFGPMDYDASTGEIYVPDMKQQRIDILAPLEATAASLVHEPRRILSFPASPQSVAITSDGQLGFIALSDGSVAMLDVPGRQIITTIHVGGSPHFLITGLYPSLFNFTPSQFSLLTLLENSLHYIAAAIVLLTAIIAIVVQKYREKRSLSSKEKNA